MQYHWLCLAWSWLIVCYFLMDFPHREVLIYTSTFDKHSKSDIALILENRLSDRVAIPTNMSGNILHFVISSNRLRSIIVSFWSNTSQNDKRIVASHFLTIKNHQKENRNIVKIHNQTTNMYVFIFERSIAFWQCREGSL